MWPRDGCEAAQGLAAAGYPEVEAHWRGWLVKSQGDDGLWRQRYWTSTQVAPAWCLHDGFEQVDQGAAAVFVLAGAGLTLPAEEGQERVREVWEPLKRGAQALADFVGPDGLHREAADLWETFRGSFTYTNAAIYAALKRASFCARLVDERGVAQDWLRVAQRVKQAVSKLLWTGDHFRRGRTAAGENDDTPDSSTLGVVVPFGLLSPSAPAERRQIELHLAWVERHLTRELDGGRGIARFPGESYLGGAIGAVNTLWMAEALLALAEGLGPDDPRRTGELVQRAEEYMRFVAAHSAPNGLLPELIGVTEWPPYWAAPHAWACGLYVRCALALDRARQKLGRQPKRQQA